MTRNDFEVLVTEIEARLKSVFEAATVAARAEAIALHQRIDVLHEKLAAIATPLAPPPAPQEVPANREEPQAGSEAGEHAIENHGTADTGGHA